MIDFFHAEFNKIVNIVSYILWQPLFRADPIKSGIDERRSNPFTKDYWSLLRPREGVQST